MEVPLLHNDAVQWSVVRVPAAAPISSPCCALASDVGGGTTPPSSSSAAHAHTIIWRVHTESSKVLEMVEMSSDQDVHRRGLHLVFEDNLSSFACVIPSQVTGKNRYIVWVLTSGGVVYRVQVSGAASGWMLCGNQQHDVSADVQRLREITSFAVTPQVVCLGGRTGSITCVPFGTDLPSSTEAEVPFELRDADPGIRGLWGFVSRGKSAGSVRSLTTRKMNDSFVLFALHEDGTLRLWDLDHRYRVLNHPLSTERELEGFEPKLMWVEEVPTAPMTFQIALLCNSSDSSRETIVVCSVTVGPGDGMLLRQGYITVQHMVSLPEGKVIDLKLLETGVWTLQSTTKGHELLFAEFNKEGSLQVCRMQEKGLAEQLMQVPGDEWGDFLYITHPTIGVSAKLTLSDVFLRRMLQPGVRQQKALQEALEQHGRPISDSDLASVSLDALRNYIISAVESESCGDSRAHILHGWMSFSSEYLKAWTRNSMPFSLVVDANNNSVGLIRRSSVATVRSLTDLEQFSPGEGRTALPDDWKSLNRNEQKVLAELMSCAKLVTDHLGRVAMGVLYESLLRPIEHPVPALLASLARILDVGFNSSRFVAEETAHMGVDDIRTKEQAQHQRQRAFALHVAHALRALESKAGGWGNVFQIISKYVGLLLLQYVSSPTGVHPRGSLSSLPKKLLSQSTSQISWEHFKSARDLLLLLVYCAKVGIQVGLTSSQISSLKSHMIPEIQEVTTASLLVHWLTVTFAEVPPPEDFSSQLSSLRLDGTSSRVGSGRIGSGDLTLGELLVTAFWESSNNVSPSLPEGALPSQDKLLAHSWQFVNWLLSGDNGNNSSSQEFSGRAISLSNILLQHGQYSSLERFLMTVEQLSSQQKLAEGVRTADGLWSARLHLLGFCLLARARTGLKSNGKENRIGEAIRCFFRAASGLGEASKDLQSLFVGTGYQQNIPGRGAAAAWRLHYYEWVMQIFEQYNLSEGACQFAHAALEQVDEAVGNQALDSSAENSTLVAAIKGRLWANVFKFSLDLDLYGNAYCAIISNPDEESKFICLRRFIVVLCERKVTQVLCGQEFPYAGLLDKVDQELLWKAENSDVSAKPSPYKLLYGLHMQRHNWRRAAACMYRYAVRVKEESHTPNLQEEMHGILAAINALQLVDPTNAWFDLPSRAAEFPTPSKRQRLTAPPSVSSITEKKRERKASRAVDLEDLEKDYALTKARMQLAHSDVKHLVIGGSATPEEVVWSLIQCRLYETAFSLLFLFWKDSLLKRELEKIMDVMARNCCLLQIQEATPSALLTRGEPATRLLLTSGSMLEDTEEPTNDKNGEDETGPKLPPAGTARTAWQALQQYLEKYRSLHPRLPVIVAESILNVDRHMELPLWLVNIFKGGKDAAGAGAGMAGLGADPAALLRIYLDFDRLAEATALVLEYIRAWSSLKPADVIKRKHMCAVWFPYTLLDKLQSCLSKSSDIAVRDKLQDSLKTALQTHFKQVKVDSDDVKASV